MPARIRPTGHALVAFGAVVAIVTALAPPARAATNFAAGVKGGFARTTMTGFDNTSWHDTFVLGAILAWDTAPWFSVMVEPSFAGKGSDIEDVSNTGLFLMYFDLPIVAKFKYCLNAPSRTGFFGTVGVAPAINTQATLRVQGAEENAASQIADFDLGLVGGAGFDWDFDSGGVVTLEARLIGGVLDATLNGSNPAIEREARNLALQFTVGFFRPFY
jgi:hypothetical protein